MNLSVFKIKGERELPKFQVVINFMHGDADGYSDNTENFATELEALDYLSTATVVCKFAEDNKYSDNYVFSKLAVDLGISEDDAGILFYDMIPHDITCDNYRATVLGIYVFANADGKEYQLVLK